MASYDQSDSGVSQGYAQSGYIAGGQYNAYSGYVQAEYAQDPSYPDQAADSDHAYVDTEDDRANYASQGAGFLAKTVSLIGACASIALVVGIGVWGYKLVMRDVSGVPVVRAIDGPMRMQPKDPGGKAADHMGLAVNAVAAQGTAAAPADTLKLAPKPTKLSDEDSALADLLATPEPDQAEVSAPVAEPVTEPVEVSLPDAQEGEAVSDTAVTAFRNGEVDALVNELTAGIPTLSSGESDAQTDVAVAEIVQPEPLQPLTTADIPEIEPAIYQGPGLARSLRPVSRPSRTPESLAVEAALRSASDATAELEDLDVDPDTLAAGTRLAQLGAFESPEVAKAEWERLFNRYGDYMSGKQRVIQMASSGGRTFYRLRALGFEDLSDARRFCSALVAGNAECIPVTTR